jgi:hypothetical protein
MSRPIHSSAFSPDSLSDVLTRSASGLHMARSMCTAELSSDSLMVRSTTPGTASVSVL